MKNLFIAVPRTGCSSVRQLAWPSHCGHATAQQLLEKIGRAEFFGSFRFGFVRHPLDRFVSLYHYFHQMPDDHQWFAPNYRLVELARGYATFRDFCLRFIEDGIWTFYHFPPQARYLLVNGKLAVNYLGRTETLQKDISIIAQQLGETDYSVCVTNTSTHPPWQECYDAETHKVISEFYAADFPLLEMVGPNPSASEIDQSECQDPPEI